MPLSSQHPLLAINMNTQACTYTNTPHNKSCILSRTPPLLRLPYQTSCYYFWILVGDKQDHAVESMKLHKDVYQDK